MEASALTHLDAAGRATMVDVGEKAATARWARARAVVRMSPEAAARVVAGDNPKGDVVAVARIAAIQAAKRTDELIPLCHQLPLAHVDVALTETPDGYEIEAIARTSAQTGVEMEALTAVSVAALTIYDMVKAADRTMVIGEIRLMEKRGGRSGEWRRGR